MDYLNNVKIRQSISPKQLALICKNNIIYIIAVAIIFGLIGCLLSQSLFRPQYTASTQVMIQTKSAKGSTTDQNNSDPITTYKDLVTSTRLLSEVSDRINNKLSVGQLAKAVQVDNTQGSELMTINVKLKSPRDSYEVANILTNCLKNNSRILMRGTQFKVTSYATMPTASTIYTMPFQTILGIIIGFILSIVYIVIISYLKPLVYDVRFLDDQLNQTVLGSISFSKSVGGKE